MASEGSVTATYRSLDGEPVVLTFPRTASLGLMQKTICNVFGKSFPKMRAGLLLTSDKSSSDEFTQQPLLNVKESEEIQVLFSITTDPG